MIVMAFMLCTTSYSMEVAITVDDLPGSHETPSNTSRLNIANRMLAIFKKHHIQGVYGLINGYRAENNPEGEKILKEWIRQGHFLGNHTFSHLDLTKVTSGEFINDIERNEPIFQRLQPHANYKYFRYPYLGEGDTEEKRYVIRNFLFSNHFLKH